MGKKKKKKSKKSAIEEYTLDSALKSTKKTESTLQDLLKGVSEGTGFYRREVKEEKRIEPQLAHETKGKKLAEQYEMEDIPISERKTTSVIEEPSVVEEEIPTIPPKKEAKLVVKHEEKKIEKEEPAKKEKEPIVSKTENIYAQIYAFFEEYLKGATDRYNLWENQVSNILAILRKMRKITQKNTEELVKNINDEYKKIQKGLDLFKLKRSEVERIADVDLQSMSSEFKKVLGLLELQVKEYQLKKIMDDYVHTVKY